MDYFLVHLFGWRAAPQPKTPSDYLWDIAIVCWIIYLPLALLTPPALLLWWLL